TSRYWTSATCRRCAGSRSRSRRARSWASPGSRATARASWRSASPGSGRRAAARSRSRAARSRGARRARTLPPGSPTSPAPPPTPSARLPPGLVPDMTLSENLVLGRHRDPALGRGPFLAQRGLADHAAYLLAEYDVRPPIPSLRAAQLSGGNQQKLIAARELT